jgi:hypothetical protein
MAISNVNWPVLHFADAILNSRDITLDRAQTFEHETI